MSSEWKCISRSALPSGVVEIYRIQHGPIITYRAATEPVGEFAGTELLARQRLADLLEKLAEELRR